MAPNISDARPDRADPAAERTARRSALAFLLSGWTVAFVLCSDALRGSFAIPQPGTGVNSLAAAAAHAASGSASIDLIPLTVLLGVLLTLTRVCLPEPDRSTLGLLVGAWLATLDVAVMGARHPFLRAQSLAPLLNTLISIGALRIVITAGVRRWNVQASRAAI
jgi:hypothetical protein